MQVWAEMKKYRLAVISDPKARRRERITALLSYLGADMFHLLFSRLYKKQQIAVYPQEAAALKKAQKPRDNQSVPVA